MTTNPADDARGSYPTVMPPPADPAWGSAPVTGGTTLDPPPLPTKAGLVPPS